MRKQNGKWCAILGVALQVGPIFGLLGTVVGMIGAFNQVLNEGQANTEALANNVSFALITTAIGLAIAVVGLVFIAVALFGFKYRAKWFFWTLIAISILWILTFPIGTVVGIVLMIYLVQKKNDFLLCEKNTTGQISGANT